MNKCKIQGHEYPLRLSLRAALELEERYGSVKKAVVGDEKGSESRSEKIKRLAVVLASMALAGARYDKEEKGIEHPALPCVDDLAEWMLDGLTWRESEELTLLLIRTANDEGESDWNAEAPQDSQGK